MKANNLLSQFGDHRQRVQSTITAVCEGRGILLVDDENRENEGDLDLLCPKYDRSRHGHNDTAL